MKKRTLFTLLVVEEGDMSFVEVYPTPGMTYQQCNYVCLLAMDGLGTMASRLLDKDNSPARIAEITLSSSKAN